MAIPFKAIKNALPGTNGKNLNKYYARVVSNGETTMEDLIKKLQTQYRIHGADSTRMLYALEEILRHDLADGKIVRLGPLGSFSPGVSSVCTDSASKVTASSITKTRIKYKPGPELSKDMAEATFKKEK
jgi:predicted histone-like DNA-binding protein